MNQPIVRLQNVSKAFAGKAILHNVSLDIFPGEFLTFLGPSGCGKTTLLKLISGFEQADEGEVWIAGQAANHLPPQQRPVHTIFQNYALFPHMTVYDNIAFGLQCRGISAADIANQVNEVLNLIKLEEYIEHKPDQLSGGQQQRVAIARALVNKPSVLLLDEPFSALDYRLRKSMQIELRQLQRELGISFVFVTHDQEEALSMSDRVAVIQKGKIVQLDSPRVVYEEPSSLSVARFIGEVNIFNCAVQAIVNEQIQVTIDGVTRLFKNKINAQTGDRINIVVRPEDLRVWDEAELEDKSNALPGRVSEIIYKGSTVDLMVRLDSGQMLSATEFFDEDDETLNYKRKERVWVTWIDGWEVVLPDED